LGDLVSGEERYVVLMLEVLPLPLLPDGSLPASLEGEELIGLEFAYTSITEERNRSQAREPHEFPSDPDPGDAEPG
jgi:hypothetical protein